VNYADLHVHTFYSDSTFSPEEVISLAKSRILSAVAICDHDSVDGIELCKRYGRRYGVEVIPCVELTVDDAEVEAHILGYFVDYKIGWFRKRLKKVQKTRIERVHKIVSRLKDEGIDIRARDIFALSGKGSVTRFHVAKVILKSGKIKTIKEIFGKYLGFGKPCYVPSVSFSPEESIDVILRAGGVPVVAHPFVMHNDEHVKKLISYGLRGIEAYHPEHNKGVTKHYEKMASENGLLVTGGSDCHGLAKHRALLGTVRVEYSVVEKLREEADRIKKNHK